MKNLAQWSAKETGEHWDYASLAVLTRGILELRLAFHYLCAGNCTDEEWGLRLNLFYLHDCTSRIQLFQEMGRGEEDLKGFSVQAEELRERLRNSPVFRTFKDSRQKELLHGGKAYLFPLEEIAHLAGIPTSDFRWFYKFLSAHAHGFPMAFYRVPANPGRGRGLKSPTEVGYSVMLLEFAWELLQATRGEMKKLFTFRAKG